jgi:hypothetical protein
MEPAELVQFLRHAATRYDRAQAGKKGYNPHALGLYFGRIEGEVMPALAAGVSLEDALTDAFNDRLRDHMLKAVATLGV